MHFRPPKKATAIGTAALALAGLTIGLAGPAHADYAPSGTDIVGIGGETPQYNLDFGADGDLTGLLGYNAANNKNKLVSIDATADANGRASYAQGSTAAVPKDLSPSVVLRAGTSPVQRTKTTGAGYTALLADTGANRQINFIRAANLPTTLQQGQATANGWGFLHVVQLGTDPLQVVGTTNTHAPAGLSTLELYHIYNGDYHTWGDLPGYSGAFAASTIAPLLPPNGSSISKLLVDDLTAFAVANSLPAFVLSGSVLRVEQNDPTAVTGSASPDDAITPFSIGRLNLWNSSYFKNPATAFPGGAVLTPGVKALTGATPDAAAAYSNVNGLYVVFRESDVTSTTPFQSGSALNWVKTLFSNPAVSPFFKKAAGQNLVAAAGGIPGYVDLGNVHL